MTPQAREEIQMLTELAYMPVAMKNKRYNGMDFLEVAFQIKSELAPPEYLTWIWRRQLW
jgi:hypothetical protein